MERIEFDENVPFDRQLNSSPDSSPIIALAIFKVEPGSSDAFLDAWTGAAKMMKREPGLMSLQMHKGIAGSGVFIHTAVWESLAHFRNAVKGPAHVEAIKAFPQGVTRWLQIVEKIAIPDICVK